MQLLAELNHKKNNIANDRAVCQYPGISVYFSTQPI